MSVRRSWSCSAMQRAFVLLSLALRAIDLSIAYALWSGVGTAVVAAIGIVWFGEPEPGSCCLSR